jgi:RHS repeat-associated protein
LNYTIAQLTGTTWSGPVAGSVNTTLDLNTFTYASNFRLATEAVNSASPVHFQYDQDGLLTTAGDLTLTYDPHNGQLTGTTLGKVSDSTGYDSFGAATGYQATAGSAALFSFQDTPDALGRISQHTEKIGGVSHTFGYAYDPAGRLTQVTQDDNTVAKYTYDANGNRLSFTESSGTVNGTYDAQDRLLSYGTDTYTYTANGDLASKTDTVTHQTTSYNYDALGNLTHVALAGGTAIDYVVDGEGRRVGKKVNGTLVQGFLYHGSRLVAELDGSGNVTSQFVYGSSGVTPAYLIQGGVEYRIITDERGSPRLVVNPTTGQVVQRMDYDAFGIVTEDTSPGFQPFGFAGGLYDRDTGLVRFGARDYNAETGRWTAKDPLGFGGGDTNVYGYVYSDPINLVDPTGLYNYTYQWAIGPASGLVTAKKAINLIKENPNLVFPFDVVGRHGEKGIVLNAEYDLNNVRFPYDNGNGVKVTGCTDTSFTFTTLPGHFDPPGSTISFRTFVDEHGTLFLEQHGETVAPIFLDKATEFGAKLTWADQAENLKRALFGG